MFTKRAIAIIGALALWQISGRTAAGADDPVETFKLTASDAAASDSFGNGVAIDGLLCVVGSFGDDDLGSSSGSAYVFDVLSGQELRKLTALDGASPDSFGISVGLSGTVAIIGAHRDDNTGSAYLFDVTTGQQLYKLKPSDPGTNDDFGWSVAISGSTAIVGAYRNDDFGSDSGAAYLFDVNSGQQLFKLLPLDTSDIGHFGRSVAIDGNTAIVGAHWAGPNGEGAVYLFDVTTGQQLRKLTPSDPSPLKDFGSSVALSGNTAVIGAVGDGAIADQSGAAYVFNVATGHQRFKLKASDATSFDSFGKSVAVCGSHAVVGAYGTDDVGINSGAVYVFDLATGQQLARLTASDVEDRDAFGYAMSGSGNHVIVYSMDDDFGSSSGAAYLFDLAPDTTPPGPVTNLRSLEQTPGVWDGFPRIPMTWTAATDDNSGLDGYSVLFDQSPSTQAPSTKVLEETSTLYSQLVSTSTNGYYFHIRAVDNAGNWGPTVHAGPYLIDALPPELVTDLQSTSHTIGAWSRSPSLALEWTAATDAHSGLAGYGISVSTGPQLPGEEQDLNAVTSTQVTLNDGSNWYFNIRSLDAVGNWDDDSVSLGPFRIDTQAPTAGTISIANGAPSTTSLIVGLNGLGASGPLSGLDRMQFSNDGSRWSPQESFATSRAGWDLSAYGGDTAPGTKTVHVRYLDAVGNISQSFTDTIEYIGVPEIDSLTPRKGPLGGGNTVTIRGTGFTSDTSVFFGGENEADVTFISSTELRVVVPPGPPLAPPSRNGNVARLGIAVDVELYTPHGSDTKTKGYVYGFKR